MWGQADPTARSLCCKRASLVSHGPVVRESSWVKEQSYPCLPEPLWTPTNMNSRPGWGSGVENLSGMFKAFHSILSNTKIKIKDRLVFTKANIQVHGPSGEIVAQGQSLLLLGWALMSGSQGTQEGVQLPATPCGYFLQCARTKVAQ